jgi:hypothetical protein
LIYPLEKRFIPVGPASSSSSTSDVKRRPKPEIPGRNLNDAKPMKNKKIPSDAIKQPKEGAASKDLNRIPQARFILPRASSAYLTHQRAGLKVSHQFASYMSTPGANGTIA